MQAANDELLAVADLLKSQTTYQHVTVAYLELAEPTIPESAHLLSQSNAGRVFLMPYFLSAGSHVTRDLVGFRRQFSEQYPDIEWILCAPLGVHPHMVSIISDRLREAEDSDSLPL